MQAPAPATSPPRVVTSAADDTVHSWEKVVSPREASPSGWRPRLVRGPSLDEAQTTFEWLGWTPPRESATATALLEHFPGALPGPAVVAKVTSLLQSPRLRCDQKATIYGTSICPDEINSQRGCLADLFRVHFDEVFALGGISGAPFAGKTGFGAFSHHVPDGGNVLLLFGPHVGISASGEVGKYLRDGQAGETASCGAVTAAYAECCAGKHGERHYDPYDRQQSWLRDRIALCLDDVRAAENPMVALAYEAYDLVARGVEAVVNTDFGSGKLILIGGIQINVHAPHKDHFLPLMFEVRQAGQETLDLVQTLR